MGFPIRFKDKFSEPEEGQIQFVTFTGNTVVTAVIGNIDGSVEVRFCEADKQGKAPSNPGEFYELVPRVVLQFPTFAAFEKFHGTVMGSHSRIVKDLTARAAAAKEPGGIAKPHAVGSGQVMPKRAPKVPESQA